MEAQAILYQALSTDPTIISLVGVDGDNLVKVYDSWHDENRGYPQITITDLGVSGAYSGNNVRRASSTPFQIDIWTKNDPTDIKAAVQAVVTVVGTPAIGRIRRYDEDAKAHRVTLETTIIQLLSI